MEFIRNHSITYNPNGNEMEVIEASGTMIKDQNGKEYLNLNDITSVLGYHHPKFDKAIANLIYEQNIAHLGNMNSQQNKMIQNLMESTHYDFSKCFVAASGGEVIDWSLKLARRQTQKDRIISYHNSLHGRSFAGAYISGIPSRKTNFGTGLENVSFIDYPSNDESESIIEYNDVAAIIIEPYQAVGGMVSPSKEYWKWLRAYTLENNIVLILDEIQTGFGKTGTMYAYEKFGIVPDILLLGKGMSNGFGLGALLMNEKIAITLAPNEMSGGSADNGFMSGVVNTVFDIFQQENIVKHVCQMGEILKAGFESIIQKNNVNWKVNGSGLFMSMDIDETIQKEVLALCREKGILFGAGRGKITVRSPLIVTEEQLEKALKILEESIDQAKKA